MQGQCWGGRAGAGIEGGLWLRQIDRCHLVNRAPVSWLVAFEQMQKGQDPSKGRMWFSKDIVEGGLLS